MGGGTLIYWDTGCAFLRVLFGWQIIFLVYFVACNKLLVKFVASHKFWVKFLALNKFLGQIVIEH